MFGEWGLTHQVEYLRPRTFRAMLDRWLTTIEHCGQRARARSRGMGDNLKSGSPASSGRRLGANICGGGQNRSVSFRYTSTHNRLYGQGPMSEWPTIQARLSFSHSSIVNDRSKGRMFGELTDHFTNPDSKKLRSGP